MNCARPGRAVSPAPPTMRQRQAPASRQLGVAVFFGKEGGHEPKVGAGVPFLTGGHTMDKNVLKARMRERFEVAMESALQAVEEAPTGNGSPAANGRCGTPFSDWRRTVTAR